MSYIIGYSTITGFITSNKTVEGSLPGMYIFILFSVILCLVTVRVLSALFVCLFVCLFI